MTRIRVISLALYVIIHCSLHALDAAAPPTDQTTLEMRASHHKKFTRLVFEGNNNIISVHTVNQKDKHIVISFPDNNIKIITKKKLPVVYSVKNDSVMVTLDSLGTINKFILQSPSRLVIDVFSSDNDNNGRMNIEIQAESKRNDKTSPIKSGNNEFEKDLNKGSIREHQEQKTTALQTEQGKGNQDQEITVPERYQRLYSFYKSGNAFAILAQLPKLQPEGVDELAIYHYLYGEAYVVAEQFVKAVEHLRLSYIYASDPFLKERAHFRRAEIYEAMGLMYEARSNYLIFINDFPSSQYIRKAHLGLANSLANIGAFGEAVKHYEQAGEDPIVLYKKANALQKLERTEEAREAYERAFLGDRYYPEKNFETYFLIGENLRLTGRLKEAKQHLSGIYYGPYRDSALISLGLIAMDEANVNAAVKYFSKAALSRERKIRARALFSLAFAHLSVDDRAKAIQTLENLRRNHIDSELYKDTLITLAKLYRKQGKLKNAVSLLKELVYGKKPPVEAFKSLEEIVIEASRRGDDTNDDDITFLDLWRQVKFWLIDESRENFLLEVLESLRHEGQPFIDLCSWLIRHGSQDGRIRAATLLAEYYIEIGEIKLAEEQITYAIGAERPGEDIIKVKAKILFEKGEYINALALMREITKLDKKDLSYLVRIIVRMNEARHGEVQQAISLYEKHLKDAEWTAEEYVRLADIYQSRNEKNRALKYYDIAFKKNPDDEWTIYRIGHGKGNAASRKLYDRLKSETIISRLARTRLMELNLISKVNEVY